MGLAKTGEHYHGADKTSNMNISPTLNPDQMKALFEASHQYNKIKGKAGRIDDYATSSKMAYSSVYNTAFRNSRDMTALQWYEYCAGKSLEVMHATPKKMYRNLQEFVYAQLLSPEMKIKMRQLEELKRAKEKSEAELEASNEEIRRLKARPKKEKKKHRKLHRQLVKAIAALGS